MALWATRDALRRQTQSSGWRCEFLLLKQVPSSKGAETLPTASSAKPDLPSSLPKTCVSHTSTNDDRSSVSTRALNSEPEFPQTSVCTMHPCTPSFACFSSFRFFTPGSTALGTPRTPPDTLQQFKDRLKRKEKGLSSYCPLSAPPASCCDPHAPARPSSQPMDASPLPHGE